MKPFVLVRGGGDIASGIIYRLRRSGYPVAVSEIAVPTMIRRKVCYGSAVHKGEMILERLTARHVVLDAVSSVMAEGVIPVLTEPYETLLEALKPDVVVDAILAKRNLGTSVDDADFVVAAGPGFTAGEDVDVVVETKRGHTLGRCIYEGAAIPNTGVPGNVGGYTTERVMHAPTAGLFTARRHIGERVEAGETVGFVEETPVVSQIGGVLRGILASGIIVPVGMKLADVDARCDESACYTISDKSLAVAGGVMEAVGAWEYGGRSERNRL